MARVGQQTVEASCCDRQRSAAWARWERTKEALAMQSAVQELQVT